jgi:acetyl esterase/lipase
VRLEARIALSLPRTGTRHRFGDDPSQVGDLHLPRGSGPHPVAVVLHGGYWQTRYGKLVTRPLALDLVGRGWAAWNVEYRRLGTGRGGGGGWPMTFHDVAAGIDALAQVEAPLDLSRVVLVGHSAGGQLALWAARRPLLPDGAVGAAPVVTARAVVALAPVTDLLRARIHAESLLGGTVDEVPDRWEQADPVRAGAPDVPAVVVHPVDDATVPVKRSREYSARCGVELVETPGAHRDPVDPTSAAWAAAVSWLDRTVPR